MSLRDDMDRGMSNVRNVHIQHLLGLGVPGASIARLGERQMPFGVLSIGHDDAGVWWPDDEGRPCVVVPVVERGEVIDVVAFNSSEPHRWWWRLGNASMLGADLLNTCFPEGGLRIVSTPLHWIAAAGEALCVLNWSAPDTEFSPLRDWDVLHVDSPLLAERLRKRLSRPLHVPTISLDMMEQAA